MTDGRINNHGKATHGFGGKKLSGEKYYFYNVWQGMRQRCYYKKHSSYNKYGGRGIEVERKTFEEFRDDMYQSYVEHCNKYGRKQTTLDRIDVNGNYCKENCRWATHEIQNANKIKSLVAIVDGIKYNTYDIMKLIGLKSDGAGKRIKKYNNGIIGKEDLLYVGKNTNKKARFPVVVDVNGVGMCAKDIANICGIQGPTARRRLVRYYLGKIDLNLLFHKGAIDSKFKPNHG